jgi:hypothetical protein
MNSRTVAQDDYCQQVFESLARNSREPVGSGDDYIIDYNIPRDYMINANETLLDERIDEDRAYCPCYA